MLLPLLAVRRLRTGNGWLKGEADAAPQAELSDAEPAGTRIWITSAVAGALLGIGNILLVVALHSGNLAVVAVLMGLYPVGTVILARLVLKERMSLVQFFGVALAITAAILLGTS